MDKTKYRTAAYLRLSKGDGDAGSESNSISNQRLIIDRFLQENLDFELSETYVDDGYTGTNFERPAMKKMLEDIDKGLIDCVVVKDVSRFGRERIETGTYILKTFREKGIRFISINDNYDSLTAGSSERHLVMPIKTMTNDAFSMDISNKVRASQSIKREKGEFMGPYAPYGYMKDPENRNHLIIDPEAAVTVREIFAKRISGMSANAIAKHLEETGVLTPSYYKEKKIEGYRSAATKPGKCRWHAKQIIRILTDEVYIGSMVQGRDYKVSYKVNKTIRRPKEEWVVVPGMHEPIVSESDFRIVQDLMERSSIRTRETPEGYLFSGLVFCADCGRTMLRKLRRQKNTSHVEYLCCGYNLKEGCTSHKILETDLLEAVTESINGMIKKLCEYSRIADNLKNISISRDEAVIQNREINRLREEAAHCEQFERGVVPWR